MKYILHLMFSWTMLIYVKCKKSLPPLNPKAEFYYTQGWGHSFVIILETKKTLPVPLRSIEVLLVLNEYSRQYLKDMGNSKKTSCHQAHMISHPLARHTRIFRLLHSHCLSNSQNCIFQGHLRHFLILQNLLEAQICLYASWKMWRPSEPICDLYWNKFLWTSMLQLAVKILVRHYT